jgi:hypothetical protein
VYVPKAVNCCFVPSATEALDGDTAIETSAAGVTVRVLEPVTDDDVAVITVCPVPTLVARPLVTDALLTVATAVLLEFQVTVAVMSCVVPSVYTPVAVNCAVVPSGILGIAGVTVIDTNAAGVTVKVV